MGNVRYRKRPPWRRENAMLITAVLLLGIGGAIFMWLNRQGQDSPSSPLLATASTSLFSGPVTNIVDGDTFDIRHERRTVRVRICGIDARERGEPGGAEAREALRSIIQNRTVGCIPVGSGTPCDGRSEATSYNRIVAQCFVGNTDIATEMVRRRRACDWPRFSGGHYSRAGGSNVCIRQ